MAFLPILAAVGTAVSAVGSFAQGQYQSSVAKNNAKIAENNAQLASAQGQQDQQTQDKKYAELQGQQIATQSASGLNLMGRTDQAVRAATAATGRQDATNLANKTVQTARNFQQEAADDKGDASMLGAQSYFNLAGGLLKSASMFGKAKSSGG